MITSFKVDDLNFMLVNFKSMDECETSKNSKEEYSDK